MLMTIDEAIQKINSGKIFAFAGDETLLKQLPKGNWIGGTIPYFMDQNGGVCTKDKLFGSVMPDYIQGHKIVWHDESSLSKIPNEAPENGFSLIIIPANSKAHISYAFNAPNYPNIFLKPIIGWISGIDLKDLGKITPKVFNGNTGEFSEDKAVVMHIQIPDDRIVSIGIINLFNQGDGDTITFESEGFKIKDCLINGNKENFAEYIISHKIDTKLPIVANYYGAMVNVSFQSINQEDKTVDLYAPVFKGVKYKIATPVNDYVSEFMERLPEEVIKPIFTCNCILNYLYSELEGKKTGYFTGPITFGEIAYQLLNQTLTYLEIQQVD